MLPAEFQYAGMVGLAAAPWWQLARTAAPMAHIYV